MSLKKRASEDAPHAIFTDGFFTWKILRTYKNPKGEAKDPYARWFVSATSPAIEGMWECGDTYVQDIIHARCLQATDEFRETYPSIQVASPVVNG